MEKEKSNTAYINGTGKVHLPKPLSLSSHLLNFEYNKFYYKEILRLLANVFEGLVTVPGLKVIKLFIQWRDGFHNAILHKEGDLVNIITDNIYAEIEFNNVYYLLFFKIERDKKDCEHYFLNCGFEENSTPDNNIDIKLLELALRNTSGYKTGCLELSFDGGTEELNNLRAAKIPSPRSNLENVFINDNIKRDINRFIHAFRNFGQYNTPLRYLLSGKPGLGKTEIIRSIIEQCSKHGSVIIPKRMRGVESLIFEFARLFSPAIVCIDDIDLLFGKREESHERKSLGDFLNELDGILENKVFLIATTNDKKLVDFAASRPGRFNEIIDFGDFERRFYLQLIKQRTNDEEIINLFSEDVFDYMESNKVSGAYIVNLVKQLKIIKDMDSLFSKDNLMEYMMRNHKGFYKTQLKDNNSFGFGNQ